MAKKREIQSSGSNVDEAIAAGLETLGLEREAVDVAVLDEGSRGLLGIGARPARVHLTIVEEVAPEEQSAPDITPTREVDKVEEIPADDSLAPATTLDDELQQIAPIARQALAELLEKMGIRAQVEDYLKPRLDEDDYSKLVLNIRGRDLGVLIGRRGETLEALQYITRLIVGREVERRINLIVDVEGYRARRERSLQQLAERMAERAVASGRRQVLEPMSAAERRIIHVTLRHHAAVATESTGEEEGRKVTIFLRGSK